MRVLLGIIVNNNSGARKAFIILSVPRGSKGVHGNFLALVFCVENLVWVLLYLLVLHILARVLCFIPWEYYDIFPSLLVHLCVGKRLICSWERLFPKTLSPCHSRPETKSVLRNFVTWRLRFSSPSVLLCCELSSFKSFTLFPIVSLVRYIFWNLVFKGYLSYFLLFICQTVRYFL